MRRREVLLHIGINTQPISFILLPVVAAPVSLAQGMPTAVQIITAAWREYLALRITYDLEAHGPSRTATAGISAGPVVAAGEEEPLPRLPCASGRGGYRSAQPE
jgi:hypothetical protein